MRRWVGMGCAGFRTCVLLEPLGAGRTWRAPLRAVDGRPADFAFSSGERIVTAVRRFRQKKRALRCADPSYSSVILKTSRRDRFGIRAVVTRSRRSWESGNELKSAKGACFE